MYTSINDFRVKKTIGSSWNVDEDDVVKTKTALKKTGDYKAPEWGVTGYPDQSMFDGLKSFQKREGLQVDGVMKPGGPTEKRLAQKTAAQPATGWGASGTSASNRAGQSNQQPEGRGHPDKVRGPTDWSGIKMTTGPSFPSEDTSEIGQELPGGRKRGPARKEKRPGDQEVAFAPLIPLAVAGGTLAMRYGPQAWRGLQGILRAAPPLVGAAEEARKQVERSGRSRDGYPSPIPQPPKDEDRTKDRSNRVAIDPPPPTPDFEPTDEKLPDRTESPAEPVEVEDLTGSLPDVQKPTVFVFPAAKPNEFGNGTIERKGNEATRKELEKVRDYFERQLGWRHTDGGRYGQRHDKVLSGEKKKGDELEEYRVPGHFGSLKGGRFSDLTFEDRNGRIVHVQTVDVDKNGKPTQKELDAAEAIRRATKHSVLLIPKGAQLERLAKRPKKR